MQTFRKSSEFAFGDVLGVGTVGTIYRAIEKATQKQVAIKKLHPGVCQDQLIRARFRREMAILERLSHPHIVSYYGGGEDDGTLFYVMELVDGVIRSAKSLRILLMPAHAILALVISATTALKASAHSAKALVSFRSTCNFSLTYPCSAQPVEAVDTAKKY